MSHTASPHAGSRLTARAAPLELDAQTFRELGHRLVDDLARFLESVAGRKAAPGLTPREIRSILGAGERLPERGGDPDAILRHATELVVEHSTLNGHPRFWGYITSSPAPIGALADLLASTVNPNLGAWSLSPIASEIERQSIRWIAELLRYPADCGGIMVSGGNMANMVCAWAGIRAGAPWDVRARGVSPAGEPQLVLYASGETHTWLDKFADLSGLGGGAIRRVEVDADGRMRADALAAAVADDRDGGRHPAFVVGTAGTVSTGVVDPIEDLAAVCREESIWFHIDGAYGAPAAVLEDVPAGLHALALGDSLAVDPHKWLYAPIEAGCSLVRDPEHLRQAFSFRPPYYRFDGDTEDPPHNFFEWGPQNTRGFRALKVWVGLQQCGREGLAASIAADCALARRMFERAGAHPEIEALTCSLSIATLRYVPADLTLAGEAREQYLNELNEALLAAMQESGEAYMSNAVIDGRFALRACIVNFRTTERDVDAVPELVARIGARVHAERRPS